ncbi:MAG TPA: hypothetical protein HA366_01935 [Candidatus Methanomethylophilaceae archaeon]|nr:hypothetical protein [Candidatus Methanomethylophilaceae archaeon]
MVDIPAITGKKLNWLRLGNTFQLQDGKTVICTQCSDSVGVAYSFPEGLIVINKKGMLHPRLEIVASGDLLAILSDPHSFEPHLRFEDGAVFLLSYLNDPGTAMAFFDNELCNIMEFTDVSTWSEPRIEVMINRELDEQYSKVMLTLGHYILMDRTGIRD